MQIDRPLRAGVIEGFFGKSWGWPARLGAAQFLRESGYEFYIYAPKSEAFLRRRWAEPLAEHTLEQLGELAARCRENGLELGIGLTPFEIYLNYGEDARRLLRSKVRQINQTGAQILCVLFDDMRGDVPDLAGLQARVIADVCEHSDATRFIACPTYYSDDPCLAQLFGAAPPSYLQDLGRAVDPRVDFFWTGEKVISDGYPAEHLARVAAQMGRKPFIWDNRTANDSRVRSNHLFLNPAAGSWELGSDQVSGLAINPMNQPYLSRIALCGYRHLLSGGPRGPHVLGEICSRLCGDALAETLLADAGYLQSTRLDRMDAQARRALRERYERETDNPYAQEIAAWLRGEYDFDPACLTS
jgi:hypothetical protein